MQKEKSSNELISESPVLMKPDSVVFTYYEGVYAPVFICE